MIILLMRASDTTPGLLGRFEAFILVTGAAHEHKPAVVPTFDYQFRW